MQTETPNCAADPAHERTRQLLFLCTGNYYRSRYAAFWFNAQAASHKLNWTADSRGLQLSSNNLGPLSPHTVARLQLRGLLQTDAHRSPMPLHVHDLERADLIVALKEAEHRPLLTAGFGQWADRVEYWTVHDLDQSPPGPALDRIEVLVTELMRRLSARAGNRPVT